MAAYPGNNIPVLGGPLFGDTQGNALDPRQRLLVNLADRERRIAVVVYGNHRRFARDYLNFAGGIIRHIAAGGAYLGNDIPPGIQVQRGKRAGRTI